MSLWEDIYTLLRRGGISAGTEEIEKMFALPLFRLWRDIKSAPSVIQPLRRRVGHPRGCVHCWNPD